MDVVIFSQVKIALKLLPFVWGCRVDLYNNKFMCISMYYNNISITFVSDIARGNFDQIKFHKAILHAWNKLHSFWIIA